jgi:hypothetical protein
MEPWFFTPPLLSTQQVASNIEEIAAMESRQSMVPGVVS